MLYALTRQEKTLVHPPTAHALGGFFLSKFFKAGSHGSAFKRLWLLALFAVPPQLPQPP